VRTNIYTSTLPGAIPATAQTPNAEFLVRDECIIDQHRQGMPIQLVVPEFDDKHFFYTATVTLERYEQLARATSKPIDLFFGTRNDDFNLAGWYEPGSGCRISPRTAQRVIHCADVQSSADALFSGMPAQTYRAR
jgi:hypothetical protein